MKATLFAQCMCNGLLTILALSGCSDLSTQSPTRTQAPSADNHPPVLGQMAKVIDTPAGPILAFSYDESGQRITCRLPVNLDAQRQPITQKNWIMQCAHPTVQATSQPLTTRELSFPAQTLFDAPGASEITPLGRRHLEQFAQSLNTAYHEPPQLVVTGYADPVGSAQERETLALHRALAIAARLEKTGVRPDLITVHSQDSAESLAECLTTRAAPIDCEQFNRRIKIKVIGN